MLGRPGMVSRLVPGAGAGAPSVDEPSVPSTPLVESVVDGSVEVVVVDDDVDGGGSYVGSTVCDVVGAGRAGEYTTP
ncbi:hypothetical protein [Gordonia sp. SMJS1]|uniref:hypothetical protein n=1 Tax=Gordonia sp. SMJS1 TaxID=3039400 RepID=UPI002457988D|nr:hypothetical protein [Gordonia sp. SMJS1]WGJ84502.1 hypothetical protein QAD21_17275 [Gordonia sp. SMJS1]